LQPRAAERIDPRVPIEKPMNMRPANTALTARLAELVNQAHVGDAAFTGAAADAERLAALAGPPQSESWIAAQEALTAAIAARKPTASALGDIDEIGATALQNQGGIAPNDLAAIDRAAAEVAALEKRQEDRIKAIQERLGS
jgi:predicted phage gp36 major capsid-like protein